MSEQVTARVDSETREQIEQQADTQAEFVRRAIHNRLNNSTTKRYENEPEVTLELTAFETRFIANRLWENAEWDHHSDQMEGDIKLMARKMHSKVAKTRSDDE